jgi:BirA family biotin operon repressor/biotin-[acetyl-CoA-carboxylase] ligase
LSRKFSISAAVKTLFIGRNRIRFDGVDSTNNYAAELLRQVGILEGTLITANYQTAGRGQRSNAWQSEAGKNILCTYILKPTWLAVDRQFALNKAVALAVQRTIQSFCAQRSVWIKWPNDVLVNDSKVAGILIENTVSGGQIVSSLAGIGVNVNQQNMSIEGRNVCSIADVLNQTFSLDAVQDELSEQLEAVYLGLRTGNDKKIDEEFSSVLYKRDEVCAFETANGLRRFVVRGVSEQGQLIVEDTEGNKHQFNHGEVHMIIGGAENA